MTKCSFFHFLLFVALFIGAAKPIKAQDRLSVELQFGYEPMSYSDVKYVSSQNTVNARFERISKQFKLEGQILANTENTFMVVRAGLGFRFKGWEAWGYPICGKFKLGEGYQTPFCVEVGRKYFSLNLWFHKDKAVPSLVLKVPLKEFKND